ncbi:MAG: type II secretion system protein N [Pseudomonadota bacterium]
MNNRGLLIAGILAFLVGASALVPARVVYHWAAVPELSLAGISGTVWNGRAEHASVAGIYFRNLEWRLRPLSLLAARLSFDAKAEPVSGFVEGRFSAGLGGKLQVSGLTASLRLAAFANALQMQGLSGSTNIRFEQLHIEDGLPVAATGTVEVADLLAPTIHRQIPLGGYRAEFVTEENGIAASIEDTDGVFDLAGRLNVDSNRSYRFLAKLAAKPSAAEALTNQLRFLGTPDSSGQYELRLEGQL